MCLITVFTPTYNRRQRLERLYSSLVQQDNYNFEWLVVDDGSTDNTDMYFDSIIQNSNPFKISYYKKENGGKHTAINYGVKKAKGKYFFIVDSDDWLPENSISILEKYIHSISGANDVIGVAGLKAYSLEKNIGKSFEQKYIDCTSLEREKNNIIGDKAEVFLTKILAKYPFPEFKNENFVTESVVWYQIANAGYKLRWFNEIVYLCQYLEDGLTNTRGKYLANYQGFLYQVRDELMYKEIPLKRKFQIIAQCGAYALIRKESLKEVANKIQIPYLVLALVGYPSKLLRNLLITRR